MKTSCTNLIVIFFFIIFITSSTYSLYTRDFFVDEVISFKIVSTLPFATILSGVDVHPPLYYLAIKLLPHKTIYQIRLISLLLMITAIGLLYYYTKEIYGNNISSITTIIILLSSTINKYGTEARMYSLLFLLSVIIYYTFHKKHYILTSLLICLSLLIHYYSIFLFIPFLITLLITEKKNATPIIIFTIVSLLILSPLLGYLIHNQLTDNPYKINPPSEPPALISIPSFFLFPFALPSELSPVLIILAFIIIILSIYLIAFQYHDLSQQSYLYTITSILTMIFIFILSFFIPYHHRYLIILFPPFYIAIGKTLTQVKPYLSMSFLILLIIFFYSHLNYHENKFQLISAQIKQYPNYPNINILHETPFSFLPLSVYLPDSSHYIAPLVSVSTVPTDWAITYQALYTRPSHVNNPNISYNIYIHYFDTPRAFNYTNNSSNLTYIKVE